MAKNKRYKRFAKRLKGTCIKRCGYCLETETKGLCEFIGYPCWHIGFKKHTIAPVGLELGIRAIEKEFKYLKIMKPKTKFNGGGD